MAKLKADKVGRAFLEVNIYKESPLGEDIHEEWEITRVTRVKEDRYNIEVFLNLNSTVVIATSSENRGLMNTDRKDYSDFNNHTILFEKAKVINMNIEPTLL